MAFSVDTGTSDALRELQSVTRELEKQQRLTNELENTPRRSRGGGAGGGAGGPRYKSRSSVAAAFSTIAGERDDEGGELGLSASQRASIQASYRIPAKSNFTTEERDNFAKLFVDTLNKERSKMEAVTRSFSRRDVRDVRGALNLLTGNIDLHSVRETSQLLGGQKVVDTFASMAGPMAAGVAIGAALVAAAQTYIQGQQRVASAQLRNLNFADENNIDPQTARNIRAMVTNYAPAAETGIRAPIGWVKKIDDYLTSESTVKELDAADNDMKRLLRSRKLGTFLADPQIRAIYGPGGTQWTETNTPFLNPDGTTTTRTTLSSAALNRIRDDHLKGLWGSTALEQGEARIKERANMMRKLDADDEYRKTTDPWFNSLTRNREALLRATEKNYLNSIMDWNKD